MTGALADGDFRRLLEARIALRRFERWGDDQAAAVGLTPAWHDLLLAVRGHGGGAGPTIGDIAETLAVRPHTAVELCNRVQRAGFIDRRRDGQDGRVVRIALTDDGQRVLAALATVHTEQLRRLASVLDGIAVASGVG